MASRRITASAIDWASFAKKVPKDQITNFNAFKSKSDSYAMKLVSLPPTPPAINWAAYEGRVKVPGLVAEFKKQYEAVSVPYPKDSYTAKITEQEKSVMAEVTKFVEQSTARQAQLSTDLAKIQSVMPVEEMNLEEYFDAYPDEALDPFDRPTMWPHTEEFQPEYLDKMYDEGKFDEAH